PDDVINLAGRQIQRGEGLGVELHSDDFLGSLWEAELCLPVPSHAVIVNRKVGTNRRKSRLLLSRAFSCSDAEGNHPLTLLGATTGAWAGSLRGAPPAAMRKRHPQGGRFQNS